MENLSPSTRAVYEFLKADIAKSLDTRFKRQDEEVLQSMRTIAGDLTSRFDELKLSIGVDLDELRTGMDRTPPEVPPARIGPSATSPSSSGSGEMDPDGHRITSVNRGKEHGPYVPPPARGMRSDHNAIATTRNTGYSREVADPFGYGPRIDLPRFDGTNPRLWQMRCEDYFKLCGTQRSLWIQFATTLFEGPAARWLEAVQRRAPNATWEEFCRLLQNRFGRNQHQALVRRLHSISQTGTVEEYVEQFAELYDQLTAYEPNPVTIHYVTRFVDGLQPQVRMQVALQQPSDLDAAYELALLHESISNSSSQANQSQRRPSFSSAVSSVKSTFPRAAEERKAVPDNPKSATTDDKWSALRAYRRAKGLCFMCGEKWGRDHQCKQSVSLHVVQEMVEFYQCTAAEHPGTDSEEEVNLMALSDAAQGRKANSKAFQLSVVIQGQQKNFLIDSGSTHSFIDTSVATPLPGVLPCSPLKVKVANGAVMTCCSFLSDCKFSVEGVTFSHDIRILPLNCYDGILGIDWLAQHSPMTVDWEQRWLSFTYEGQLVTLQGAVPPEFAYTIIELSLITDENAQTVLPEI